MRNTLVNTYAKCNMQNKNYPQTKTLIQRGVGKPTRTKLIELRELLGDLDVLTN